MSISDIKKSLLNLMLNDGAKEIAENFDNSDIRGAEVVGRGTIVVDGKEIASSEEFSKLRNAASKIVAADNARKLKAAQGEFEAV